jgi:hypothetical protein
MECVGVENFQWLPFCRFLLQVSLFKFERTPRSLPPGQHDNSDASLSLQRLELVFKWELRSLVVKFLLSNPYCSTLP